MWVDRVGGFMISFNSLGSAADYTNAIYGMVIQFESSGTARLTPYIDPFDTYATMGAGFNIETSTANRNAVFNALGIGAGETAVRASLTSIIQNAATTASLVNQLNAVMAERAETIPGARATFSFADEAEVRTVFNVIAPRYEAQVDNWLSGVDANSRERAVLFDLAYNNAGVLLGNGLRTAISDGNRAEAFFEIRYGSNGGASASNGIAKRRYVESHIFGLYEDLNPDDGDDVSQAEAFQALQMATRRENKVAQYDLTYQGGFNLANAELTAIEARSQDFGTVVSTMNLLTPANQRLVYDFADFDRLFPEIAAAATVRGSALADFSPAKVWVAALTSAASTEVAANTVDRSAKSDSDLIFGGRNVDGSDSGRADTLKGGGGADMFVGGGGADVMDGGAGEDTVSYHDSPAGIVVSLLSGNATGGDAAGDRLSNIENVIGTALADRIAGNGEANILFGGGGIDALSGGDGADTLIGGAANDTLNGGAGDDVAVFSGQCPDYDISYDETTGTWTVAHLRGTQADGTDTLTGVEFVQFGDKVSRLEVGRSICPTGGVDLALVIDTTGSMSDDIAAVKAAAASLIADIFDDPLSGADSRVGIVGYKDPGETTAILNFTEQATTAQRKAAALAAINGISVGGGGDIPEGVYSGLYSALSGAIGSWNMDANIRRIVLFGDAPPRDFELQAQVEALARDILTGSGTAMLGSTVRTDGDVMTFDFETQSGTGPIVNHAVEIYTVLVGADASALSSFQTISDNNGGLNIMAAGADNVVDALREAVASPYLITVEGTIDADVLDGSIAGDRLLGLDGVDILRGYGSDDALLGGAGDDDLDGGAGNDRLEGGTGNDRMFGGVGDDLYIVDSTGDVVIELVGEGVDLVRASVDYRLTDNVENLTLSGTAISGIGNALGNHMVGNAQANVLIGGGGGDTIEGGAGNDVLRGDSAPGAILNPAGSGNSSIATALALGGFSDAFDPNIANATTQGHVSIAGSGDGTFKYYSVTILAAGDQATFDIDGASFDSYIRLMDGAGNILASNDDASTGLGGGGSSSSRDSFLNVTFSAAGTYYLEVAQYSRSAIAAGASFTLQVSLSNVAIAPPPAASYGDDTLIGGEGADFLDGGAGRDSMTGGNGNDSYSVDNAYDGVIEEAFGGIDAIYSSISYNLAGSNVETLTLVGGSNINGIGGDTAETINGNSGNNRLLGNGGNDTLNGGEGDDILNGGAGNDAMVGGLGNDIYYVDSIDDIVTELAAEGDDQIFASVSYTLAGRHVERLTLTGIGDWSGAGNDLAQTIIGNIGNNLLSGFAGNDRLEGRDGNDTLDGGGDADVMIGGAGDDIYYVDNLSDSVVELAGEGNDTVYSAVNFVLGPQHVENLILIGAFATNATGNSLANSITGNELANRIDGGKGADRMAGGLGNDVYYVDNAGDGVIEASGEGTDIVYSSVSFSLGPQHIENLVLTGTAAINATGNSLVNGIRGNAGNNSIDGGRGADTMAGGLGDDIYYVDNVGDNVIELSGEGSDTINASVSYSLLGRFVEQLNLTGAGNIDATGNGGANTLAGNSGHNILRGLGGNDVLTGGGGQDRFVFDTVAGAGNVDRITDFSVIDDLILLDNAVYGALGAPGALAAGALRIGTGAVDADDRIIYNSASGFLFYDADGVGAADPVLFARLTAGLALTQADFLVI